MGVLGGLDFFNKKIKPTVTATRTIGRIIIRAISPELNFPEDFLKYFFALVSVLSLFGSYFIFQLVPSSKSTNKTLLSSIRTELSKLQSIESFILQFKL